MNTVAIIQARMGATRLPGKVLFTLGNQTVLHRVAGRVSAANGLDMVMVATSELSCDDPIAAECNRHGIACFRGSETDVLSRYHGAALMSGAEVIVRVTADCPLFDGSLLGAMLQRFRGEHETAGKIDYLSNCLKRTYPRGLDAEIFTRPALERAHAEARLPHQREHVTPYFYEHPDRFGLVSYEGSPDLSRHRWTLDTPDDWKFFLAVNEALPQPDCATHDVLALLAARPHLSALNGHVEQKQF